MEDKKFVNVNSSEQKSKFNEPKVKKGKTKHNLNMGKTVVVPFVSGLLGATLVVTLCANVPSINSKLYGKSNTTIQTIKTTSGTNTNYVSLSSINDTGVSVATKVLPQLLELKLHMQ